jgi:hypothetical protein
MVISAYWRPLSFEVSLLKRLGPNCWYDVRFYNPVTSRRLQNARIGNAPERRENVVDKTASIHVLDFELQQVPLILFPRLPKAMGYRKVHPDII